MTINRNNNLRAVVFTDLPSDVVDHLPQYLSPLEVPAFMNNMSRVHRDYFSLFKAPLEKQKNKTFEKLLQAIIDNDGQTVKIILNAYPQLLLQEVPKNLVIESQCTGQRFYGEKPLAMAAKRKQYGMTQLLLNDYYPRLDVSSLTLKVPCVLTVKEDALALWTSDTKIVYVNGVKHYVHKEYGHVFQALIKLFVRGEIPKDPTQPLNTVIEEALDALFNTLFPSIPITLDDYLDVELFLLEAYDAYVKNFHRFQHINQQLAYFIRVIGLIQSALSPEAAKIYCRGFTSEIIEPLFYNLDDDKHSWKESLLLKDESFFYRTSPDVKNGPGYQYFYNNLGERCPGNGENDHIHVSIHKVIECMLAFNRLFYYAKSEAIKNLTQSLQLQPSQSCTIL